MPEMAKSDIFLFADSVDFLIVFGHSGFNEMGIAWDKFRRHFPSVDAASRPFTSFDEKPFEYAPGRFIVTVAEAINHGMSDDQLCNILSGYLHWAGQNGIRSVATNGIVNIDHSQNIAANCVSDNRRARMIIDLATSFERAGNTIIYLSSLDDVFIRNSPLNRKN